MRTFLLSMAILLLVPACTPATPSSEQAAVETVVAATLSAADNIPVATPDEPTPRETASEAHAAEPVLVVAYTVERNLWVVTTDTAPRQLTADGAITEIVLSEDADRIAYVRSNDETGETSLHVYDLDVDASRLLLDQSVLDTLYPTDPGARLTLDLRNLQFLPGSHNLLLSTQYVYQGPGARQNNDLYRINTDSGELSSLLGIDAGGRVSLSPDASSMALTTPDSLRFVSMEGAPLGDVRLRFDNVLTYSEYAYVPQAVWSPDGAGVYTVIPSPDPFAPDASARVMRVTLEDSPPETMQLISGSLFILDAFGAPWIDPTTSHIAYLQTAGEGSRRALTLAPLAGGATTFITEGSLEWEGWSPDGTQFAYTTLGADSALLIAAPGRSPELIPGGRSLRWVDGVAVVLTGTPGDWTLLLYTPMGEIRSLATSNGEFVAYDVAMR